MDIYIYIAKANKNILNLNKKVTKILYCIYKHDKYMNLRAILSTKCYNI